MSNLYTSLRNATGYEQVYRNGTGNSYRVEFTDNSGKLQKVSNFPSAIDAARVWKKIKDGVLTIDRARDMQSQNINTGELYFKRPVTGELYFPRRAGRAPVDSNGIPLRWNSSTGSWISEAASSSSKAPSAKQSRQFKRPPRGPRRSLKGRQLSQSPPPPMLTNDQFKDLVAIATGRPRSLTLNDNDKFARALSDFVNQEDMNDVDPKDVAYFVENALHSTESLI